MRGLNGILLKSLKKEHNSQGCASYSIPSWVLANLLGFIVLCDEIWGPSNWQKLLQLTFATLQKGSFLVTGECPQNQTEYIQQQPPEWILEYHDARPPSYSWSSSTEINSPFEIGPTKQHHLWWFLLRLIHSEPTRRWRIIRDNKFCTMIMERLGIIPSSFPHWNPIPDAPDLSFIFLKD